MCYIPILCDILPLPIEIRPRISGSMRITGNETQGGLMHMWVIYGWAPNMTGKENYYVQINEIQAYIDEITCIFQKVLFSLVKNVKSVV